MRFGSVATSVRKGDVASFAAVRAIIKAIHAKTNVKHALADGAVLVASALVLGLVALNAEHRAGGHRSLLEQTLPELAGVRQGGGCRASCCRRRRQNPNGLDREFDLRQSAV